jgi:pyridoxamine 5'-phosphate oxidase
MITAYLWRDMSVPEHQRSEYLKSTLDLSDLTPDPLALLTQWWEAAHREEIVEVNAMTLATVDEQNRPSARIVLLRGITPEGIEFYTNYQSRKAIEIAYNPNVALIFFWKEMERQVRVEGVAEKLSRVRSEAYFQSRPRGSQIGAWASPQSEIIKDRSEIDDAVRDIEKRFEGQETLPLPEYWGGYLVRPYTIEFWQGRDNRLHDRFRYKLEGDQWVIERLAP